MSQYRNRAGRRSVVVALVLSTVLAGFWMRPAAATHEVTSVTGSAYGHYVNASFFGTPQPPSGPDPTVTLPAAGGSETATDPDGAEVVFGGVAVLFQSGAMTVSTQGTVGSTGSVTSSSNVVGYQDPAETPPDAAGDGPDPFTWQDLTSTCSASAAGSSGATEIVGGVVVTSTDSNGDPVTSVAVPVDPAPNHTVDGTINHVPPSGATFRIVFNEQTVAANGTRTVNAAHVYFLTGAVVGDLIIGQSVCGVTRASHSNVAPVAGDDSYATPYQTVLDVAAPGVLANDSDADGQALTSEMPTEPANGTLALDTDGSFTYTPDAGFSGTDTFTYMVHDPVGGMDTGTVTVTVGQAPPPPNRPPVAVDDPYDTAYQTALNVSAPGVLGNDSDPDGDPLTAGMPSDPANGSVVLNADGSFTYTPDAGFSGIDTFTYMAHDPDDAMDSGTVTVTVGQAPPPPNAAPVAVDDPYDTAYQTPLVVSAPGVLGNDSDPDGDPLTAGMPSDPANGSVVLNADGSFTYTPDAGFSGIDTFTYMAHDPDDAMDSGTVTVTVGQAPPPPNAAPVAVDDPYDTAYQTPLVVSAPGVLGNDADPDGDPLTAGMPSDPANGSVVLNADGSFTYTPDAGFSGIDTFTYMVHDPDDAMDTGTVTVTVGQAPPPPNRPPVAVDDPYDTAYQTPLVVSAPGVLGNDADPDGDPLTAGMPSDPANGSVVLNADGSFTYTPDAGFSGIDTFTYMAHDPDDAMDTGTVTITVSAAPPPPNAAPVAVDDAYDTAYQTALNVSAPGVLGNDADPDGDPLTAVMPTLPANGSLVLNADGSFTYTPDAGFSGTDRFSYMVRDPDNAMDTGEVVITVGQGPPPPPNTAPVAVDDGYAADYQTALNVAAPGVLGNDTDADGDPLTAVTPTQPANGTVTVNADGSFTYTPDAGFSGPDTFTYAASDPDGATDTATVTVTVGPAPPPPAQADLAITIADVPDPVMTRDTLTYTLVVTNLGPDPARATTFFEVPGGMRFVSSTGVSCTELRGRTKGIACESSQLASGDSVSFDIVVSAPGRSGTVTARATVSSSTADPNLANNTATEETIVQRI